MRKRVSVVILVLFLFLPASIGLAASEAVQIRLSGDSGRTRYIVPAGKVLILEHVMFSDYWEGQSEPFQISVSHSLNPAGTAWSSEMNFYSTVNPLPRVLRVPAGTALTMPNLGSILYKTFLYGTLVDANSTVITE